MRSAVNRVGRLVLEDPVELCLLTAAAEGPADDVWLDLQKALRTSLKT